MKFIIIVMLAWITTSCTINDSTYTSYMNQDSSFFRVNTFAWLPKDSSTIKNILFDNEIIGKEIRINVSEQLQNRGFTMNRDTPDILLQYSIVVEEKEEVITSTSSTYPTGPRGTIAPYNSNAYNSNAYDTPWNLYFYSNPGNLYNPGYNANNYPYNSSYGFPNIGGPYMVGSTTDRIKVKEGTLVIDIIDRRTNELIWRGWGTNALTDPNNYKKSLNKEIRDIFKEFPSSQAVVK